jgi:purine-binding chemotaxis protein CheW
MSKGQVGGARQLCTFLVNDLLFGVDVIHVQEVIRYQQMTPVPLSPTVVTGLINLRGQIVTALDMRERLGLARRTGDQLPTNIVVRHAEGVLSLLVDEIGDVVEVDPASFEAPPDTLAPGSRALIDGVYKLKSQLLLLLNTDLAVRVDFHGGLKRNDHVEQ